MFRHNSTPLTRQILKMLEKWDCDENREFIKKNKPKFLIGEIVCFRGKQAKITEGRIHFINNKKTWAYNLKNYLWWGPIPENQLIKLK